MGNNEGKRMVRTITVFILTLILSGSQVYGCWEPEKSALLLIQESLRNQYNMTDLLIWKDGKKIDCCDWVGVTCGKNKRIISLSITSFSDAKVGWRVNATIFRHFQELGELDLSGNSIVGWIPATGSMKLSSNLKKLEVLNLRDNMLNNTIFQQLSGFQMLKHLDLEYNQLEGHIGIHDILAISEQLEELDLSHNNITCISNNNDCGPNHRFQKAQVYGNTSCLSSLATLRESDLSYNKLEGEIPLWLQNLTSLDTLDLSANKLTGNIASSSLIQIFSLKDLELSANNFQIPDTFQSFVNHSKLKYFVADLNQVVHQVQKPNVEHFGFQLEVLSLSQCSLFSYPPFLHHQHELRLIDLSHNLIDGNFPTWMFENNLRLDTLILVNNSFSGSFRLPSIPHVFISQIYIAQNKIQGHIPSNIDVIFPNLNELDMSANGFEGNIPSSLRHLTSLKGLSLSNNHLSGEIGDLSGCYANVSFLDLSRNNFNGELPSFNGLESLIFLNLDGNQFSGNIATIMFGPSLEMLILSNNSLEGPIPKDIFSDSKRSNLLVLDLSYNKFSGTLPNCCSSSLMFLFLNNNRLSGDITDTFCNNTSGLVHLDLSNNNLNGHIPVTIGNLTGLSTLILRGNHFQGEVPLQLCNLLNLAILDLSFNSFNGLIPSCLSNITFFGGSDMDLDFLNDNFRGIKGKLGLLIHKKGDTSFSYTFSGKFEFTTKNKTYTYKSGILLYMVGIDLSYNMFTGQIPQELGKLSNLHALNLSHNKLWGAIPPTLSSLTSIESLDFSYNHLNGSIPTTLIKLNALEVFKVSYNNFSGRIPFEAQFSTFDASSYQGNPFLCGPPLPNSCITNELPSVTKKSSTNDEDSERIDLKTFIVTFIVSGVTMFLSVVIIMFLNPQWLDACIHLTKSCITSTVRCL